MKLLVLGGMHGNEMLGIRLVESLLREPISNIDAMIANPRAVSESKRYVETDLNRSFGSQPGDSLERRRAKELTSIIAGYDVVLDFHNTQTPGNNCCFLGVQSHAYLYILASQLGFRQCVQATYECINKYNPNVLSVEISEGDDRDSVEYWRQKLGDLAGRVDQSGDIPEVYRFSRRVTWQEKDEFKAGGWQPFQEISDEAANNFAVTPGSVPIFIGSRLTEYYATLLEPVDINTLTLANNR